MAIYSGFTHWKWWFSIAMLVYQRVNGLDKKQPFWSSWSSFPLWKKRSDTSGRVNFHRDGLQCVNVSTWKLMRNTVKPENYEWPYIYTFPVGHIDILEHQISGGHIQTIKKLGARKYPPSPRLVKKAGAGTIQGWGSSSLEHIEPVRLSHDPRTIPSPVYKPWNAPKMRVNSPPKHGFWVVSCHGKDWSWVDSTKSPDFPHPATMIGKTISRFLGCPVLS